MYVSDYGKEKEQRLCMFKNKGENNSEIEIILYLEIGNWEGEKLWKMDM